MLQVPGQVLSHQGVGQREGDKPGREGVASIKMTSCQDSLIEFLKMAHIGVKGAAFLPDGSPAAAADVGNVNH